jgi:hypothetical protein
MIIKMENLENLVAEADKIVLDPRAEDVLIKLLDLQEQVEKALKEAKERIEKKALEMNPNVQSIRSDRLKVFYRQYGSRYKIDESYLDQIPKELYTSKTVYSPVPKAIDEWTRKNDGMPIGIIEPERPKQLSFSKREKADHE